ncbi:hypothetical protein KP509_04G044500 [Ceratopteris richardii]|nr:hypothetical protein KP509_04G044500 [Ceratopteris richardii]
MTLFDKSLTLDFVPMCFSRMQEKISSNQYPTWISFVDDFESMCQNAMKHSQKQSEVWNAAKLLLVRGRKCLEKHLLKGQAETELLGDAHNNVGTQGEEISLGSRLQHNEENLPGISLDNPENTRSSVGCMVIDPPAENLINELSSRQEIDEKCEEHCVAVVKSSSSSSRTVTESYLEKNAMVDIMELAHCDILRFDSNNQAVDCSSSFGDTQSVLSADETDGEKCEAESEHRNGNGAMALMDEVPSNSMSKKRRAVNLEWKNCRQGIEWRCRWLELRLKELQVLSKKYTEIVDNTSSMKRLESEEHESISARTSAIFDGHHHHVIRRMGRRKEEEIVDSKMHMSKHPLFSRYEKKQHCIQEDIADEEINKDELHQILDFDDFHQDFDDGFEGDFLAGEDSIEQFLWHIEKLQMHICELQTQLSKGTIGHGLIAGQVKDSNGLISLSEQVNLYETNSLMSSPGYFGSQSLLSGYKTQGGKSIARKRSADVDIDSVIMPDIVMANYVEPARHSFIETPHWRVLGDASASARGGSSEEDSDDEAYKKHPVEIQEMKVQDQEVMWNKNGSLAFVREQSYGEKDLNLITADASLVGDVQSISSTFGFVPRRKRRRRESRGNASVAKNIEPLLTASYENMTDTCDPFGPVEDGDNQRTSSTG